MPKTVIQYVLGRLKDIGIDEISGEQDPRVGFREHGFVAVWRPARALDGDIGSGRCESGRLSAAGVGHPAPASKRWPLASSASRPTTGPNLDPPLALHAC